MGEQLTAGLQRWSIIVVGLRYATHLLLLLLRMLYVLCVGGVGAFACQCDLDPASSCANRIWFVLVPPAPRKR